MIHLIASDSGVDMMVMKLTVLFLHLLIANSRPARLYAVWSDNVQSAHTEITVIARSLKVNVHPKLPIHLKVNFLVPEFVLNFGLALVTILKLQVVLVSNSLAAILKLQVESVVNLLPIFPDKKGQKRYLKDNFPYFCIETYTVTSH